LDMALFLVFKAFGYPLIITLHNVNPLHKKPNFINKKFYKFIYRFFNIIITHSLISKKELHAEYGVPNIKIKCVPHGNYKFFVPKSALTKEDAKAQLGIDRKSKTVLFFGAIRENKRLEDILYAWPKIKFQVPDSQLIIAGEAKCNYRYYSRIIKELNIESSVKEFIKYIPNEDIPAFFYATDVVALPYKEVSQSGVLQLAFAFGLPVVATTVGGFTESIEDGVNGFLIPPLCINMLSDKIINLLTNPDISEKMGRRSLLLASNKYSWQNIALQTESIYEQLEKDR
jgi:D-inositol-3-phosphate glycosyltransferase